MQVIADLLDIHPVEVHSVVSFYSFLDERPQGQFVIRLCRTVTCDMAGKEHLAEHFRSDLQFDSARPRPTASSRWAGPTAWGCAIRGRRCWSTSGSSRG